MLPLPTPCSCLCGPLHGQVLLVPLDSSHRAAVRFRGNPVVTAGGYSTAPGAAATLIRVASAEVDDSDFGGLLLWKLRAGAHAVDTYYDVMVAAAALVGSP
jgi:hypothetical protein